MLRNSIPRWTLLRNVGNLAVVRFTMFIPLVGYLIIFNNKIVDWLDLAKDFVGLSPAPGLTVSPRLLLIYFGLCAIALGSAIYSVLCPPEIKHYGTSAAYVGGDGPNIGDIALEPIEHRLRSSESFGPDYVRIRERYETALPQPNTSAEQRENYIERRHQVRNGILHLYFEYLDDQWWLARLLSSILFFVGFVCLLIPAARVFWQVSSLLLTALTF